MDWNKDMNKIFRVVGIDPGSSTFGLTVIDYDLETGIPTVIFSETFFAEPLLDEESTLMNLGQRGARHALCKEYVIRQLDEFKPQLVCCESAFLKMRFVNAFQSLVEGIVMVRQALYEHDDTMSLLLVDPPTAKKAVGAPGKGGDKLAILYALRKLKGLKFSGVELEELDEHSRDSVAICYWGTMKWLNSMQGIL